jgi:nitrate/nitrite transport system substrate-binding protein
MAVIEAQQWCERAENKRELAEIVARRQWFNVPVADIIGRLKGDINYGRGRLEKGTNLYMKFWSEHASYPFKSHDMWFVTENIRWGKLPLTTDVKALVNSVNREDLWHEAAKALSLPASDIPPSSSRGRETFFDGKVFDPGDPVAYLRSLAIKRVEV